jgi:predicted PurR-regulated permease PerM
MTRTSKAAAPKNGLSVQATKNGREGAARGGCQGDHDGEKIAPVEVVSFDAWLRPTQVSLLGLFVIALLWCAYVAQPVVVPVLLAWVIATIVLPFVEKLEARGVPRALGAIAVSLLLVAVIVGLLVLLSTPAAYWLSRASEVGGLIREKLQTVSQPLSLLDEVRKAINVMGAGEPTLKVEQHTATVVTAIFSVLTPAVSQFILFIGALLFYLVYQKRLRSTIVLLLSDREARLATLRTLSEIDANMARYFGAFTIVNAGLGVVTVALTWAVGLPNPLLWGVLAAVLNYVPYIGPAIVLATLGVVGLLTYSSLSEAAFPPLIFLGIVMVEGHFLTPILLGRRLELNPFAIFLAIAFCTWLWGPLGAFLAVPLLMALAVTVGHAFAEEKPELPA